MRTQVSVHRVTHGGLNILIMTPYAASFTPATDQHGSAVAGKPVNASEGNRFLAALRPVEIYADQKQPLTME